MNKLDLSRCLMFRTDPSVDSGQRIFRVGKLSFKRIA